MFFSKHSPRKLKKAVSLFLGSVLVLNTAAMVRIKANGVSAADAKSMRDDIIKKAAAYLSSQENDDNSYGDSRLINDTTEALIGLRAAGKNYNENSEKWLTDNISFDNNDMVARLSAATLNLEYLSKLKGRQNENGGFGLYSGYSSDVLDTVLVLEAVNDTGYSDSEVSGEDMCKYLLTAANADGGYSYSPASGSDDILTAMVVYNVDRLFAAKDFNMSLLNAQLTYLEENVSDSYEDSDIKKTLYKYLAMEDAEEEIDSIALLNELSKAEKSNGSFADDIETTSVAIRLLKSLDLENKLSITDFDTTLSQTDAVSNGSNTVTATSVIGYSSNFDAELDVKLSLYSGDTVVYENTVKAQCSANDTSITVDSGEFTIAEPDGSEVYVIAELYNGNKLVGTQRIDIDITAFTPEYSTDITDLSVELDTYSVPLGSSEEVGINYDLLYATNIEYDVTMKTVVTYDGKVVASDTEDAVLTPDRSSLKKTPLKFVPDKAGIYNVKVSCIDKGEEIFSREASLEVIEPPVIEEKQSEEEKTQFEVTWFGPLISDYVVYAGNESEINAGASLNYFSNDVWNGKIEINVMKKDELITETAFDVELEKGEITVNPNNGLPEYPIYKSGDKLSFTVKDTGEYIVNAKLLDAEGNVLKEGKATLKVIDRPVQDLILNSCTNSEKDNMIDLSWNDISSSAESYTYQLYRKTNGTKWEPRSIWNEEERINVLNVYPASPYLADWMTTTISDTETPAGKGIFDIDSVHIATFNSSPETYMKNDDGSWKYDVIFFGSSDCNSGYDMGDKAAELVHSFIDSGRGVFFGHDTMNTYLGHKNFDSFGEKAGLHVRVGFGTNTTSSVSVVKIGTLTNYPWEIRGNMNVPTTHTSGQFITDATEWITLNAHKYTDPDTGGQDGFYLATYNNVGMIQTGHSNGQATDDERKILANTMFYLYQISQQTTAKDASFYDIDAPDKPVVSAKNSGGKAVLNVSAKDNPTEYEYYISANPMSGSDKKVLSNVKKHTILAGIAGFVVKVDSSSEPNPELIERDENGENILGIVPADAKGNAVIEAEPDDISQKQYIHVFAVDKANNVSEEYIIPFADTELKTNIATDKKLYAYGDKVEINADTVSAPFGEKADMKIEIYDEFNNKTAELTNVSEQVLTANETLESNAEWSIPAETDGRYKAVINWYKDNEIISSAESGFKIANEKSIVNYITSNKKTYSYGDPINLIGNVTNSSKAMTENDLVLNVKVFDSNNKEVASFSHDIGVIVPDGAFEHSDAIAPKKLPGGKYQISASVMQGDMEVSNDTANITVKSDPIFTGKLDLTPSGGKASADFTVSNSGDQNAENALVTVKVYKADSTELVYEYSDTVSINSGETFTGKTSFDIDKSYAGKYSAVLSVEYNEAKKDLDFAGFEKESEIVTTTVTSAPAETTTSAVETSTTTTASSSATTAKSTSAKTDSPKTGDSGIPAYMWLISILSVAGLIALRKKGDSENE